MGKGVKRVIPLTLGWEYLPKSWSLYGWDPQERLTEPVPGVLVEIDGGYILLDTGFNPALIRDPALNKRFHGETQGARAILPEGEGDPLLDALARAKIELSEIVAVGLSHLHNDHAGGLRHFAGGVPVFIQRRELAYGLRCDSEPEHNGIFRVDFDDPTLNFVELQGDTDDEPYEIAPGVSALPTFGHTPGHQSFIVRYDKSKGGGGFVFAFDAGDLRENFTEEWPVGGVIDVDPALTVLHIKRLKSLASESGMILVPGHDPHVWPKLSENLLNSGGVIQPELTTENLFS